MKRLEARLIETADGERRLASPDVATFVPGLADGDLVRAGTVLGRGRRLGRDVLWIAPDGTPPSVVTGLAGDRRVALEYAEVFAELTPLATEGPVTLPDTAGAAVHDVLTATTDGVFYRRSSPEAPPFVEPGSVVADGDAVGLIEVMKTFSRVSYGGERLPIRARIVDFLAVDGQEVLAGQPLLSVEPEGGSADDG